MFHVTLKLRFVNLNYNFECDWFIELSDNKLSNNNLARESVENRSTVFKPITIQEIVMFMMMMIIIIIIKTLSFANKNYSFEKQQS